MVDLFLAQVKCLEYCYHLRKTKGKRNRREIRLIKIQTRSFTKINNDMHFAYTTRIKHAIPFTTALDLR